MPRFSDYIAAAHAGINKAEEDLDVLWRRDESFLSRHETALRGSLIALLLLWPFDSRRRRLDWEDGAEEIRRIRGRANREVRRWEREVLEGFVGRAGAAGQVDEPDDLSPSGLARFARRFNQEAVLRAYGDAGRLLERLTMLGLRTAIDQARGLDLLPGRPSATPELPAPPDEDRLRDELERAARVLRDFFSNLLINLGVDPEYIPRHREGFWAFVDKYLDDLEAFLLTGLRARDRDLGEGWIPELLLNGISNPAANLRYESRRIIEQIKDLSMGSTSRGEVIEYVNGTSDPSATRFGRIRSAGIAVNRNNMRLSVQAHVRAAFRSELVRFHEGLGTKHFLLEYPASRRDDISPRGAIAEHAHQVRTIDEWRAIVREMNQGRRTSATFEGLGFHHGDFSMPVPIPGPLVAAAEAYGKDARARLLARLRRAA